MSTGILLHSSPFVCGGRGRTLMSPPLTLHPWKVRLGLTPAACTLLESRLHHCWGCAGWKKCGPLNGPKAAQHASRKREECEPVHHLHIHQDSQECGYCLMKMGSSALILSSCRLNILSRFIVLLLLLLFWLGCGGKGQKPVVWGQKCAWWFIIY